MKTFNVFLILILSVFLLNGCGVSETEESSSGHSIRENSDLNSSVIGQYTTTDDYVSEDQFENSGNEEKTTSYEIEGNNSQNTDFPFSQKTNDAGENGITDSDNSSAENNTSVEYEDNSGWNSVWK